MLLNKHAKTVVSVIDSWLKDFDEKSSKILGKTDEYIIAANCLS